MNVHLTEKKRKHEKREIIIVTLSDEGRGNCIFVECQIEK